jgi:hypothetical protein
MAVKFRLGFTLSAETLFGLMAKMLPIEDLQVEEVPEILPKIGKVEKIAQLSGPKIRPERPRGNRYSNGPILDRGGNAIVLKLLSDGLPHSAHELKPLFTAAGYAPSGVGSRLDKLKEVNVIHQPDYGLWRIGEPPPKKKAASG